MKNNRYQELDSLRGMAALFVVFFHFTMLREESQMGFKLGVTGVDLFFMISGFVILLSLNHVKNSKQFIINRISRLYPTYWASVTFTFVLIIVSALSTSNFEKVNIVNYFANMTMFQRYLKTPDLDGSYWTMIIEMLFYIFMLILFHFKVLKYLNRIGVFLMLFIVLFLFLIPNNIWVRRLFILIPFLKFWPLFFAGILFYTLSSSNVNKLKYYLVLMLCFVCQLFMFEISGRSNDFLIFWEYLLMLFLYFGIFTLFVSGKLKFVIKKPLLFLGRISFALYLIHQFLSIGIIIPFLTKSLNLNFWLSSIVALIISIGIATLITEYIGFPYSAKMKSRLTLK